MKELQLDGNYTKTPNKLLDYLATTKIPQNQRQIIQFLIRKTYGFQKRTDYITNTQVVKGTKLHKVVVSRCLKALGAGGRGIIVRNGKHIGFSEEWEQVELTAEPTVTSEPTIELETKDNPKKQSYGELGNVKLTGKEYEALVSKFGEDGAKDKIEGLSLYKGSKGKKYASDYLTILNWDRRDRKEKESATHKQSPRPIAQPGDYINPKKP